MDWDSEVRLLGMKKQRLQAMRALRRKNEEKIRAAENEREALYARLELVRLTGQITRLNDEIFSMAQRLGIDPETGEIPGGIPAIGYAAADG